MKTHTHPHDYQKPGYLYEPILSFKCRVCGAPTDKSGGLCWNHASDLRDLRLSLHTQNAAAIGYEYFDLDELLDILEKNADHQAEKDLMHTCGHTA